jgi:hypothetical protein
MKKLIANLLYFTGISYVLFRWTLKSNSIRAINYHCTPQVYSKNFCKQLAFYKRYFDDVNLEKLDDYFENLSVKRTKPGLIITFDDGLRSNFDYAVPFLENYGFTGWFFIPTGFISQNDFDNASNYSINLKQYYLDNRYCINLEELDHIRTQHIVGCHTYSHHRFSNLDTKFILDYEIKEAKEDLEKLINGCFIEVFAWVGGELNSYTFSAYNKIIDSGFKYAFTTNNYTIYPESDKFNLNRTNIESCDSMPMVLFQLSGLMDLFYFKKRRKIVKIFNGDT